MHNTPADDDGGDDDDGQMPNLSDSEGRDTNPDYDTYGDGLSRPSDDDNYDGDNVSIDSTASIAPGSTPLHVAIDGQKVEIVKLLLQNGADMHIEDIYGLSAMDLALSLRDDGYEGDNNRILRLLREFDTKGVDTKEVGEMS
jgi:hypothetical protein